MHKILNQIGEKNTTPPKKKTNKKKSPTEQNEGKWFHLWHYVIAPNGEESFR